MADYIHVKNLENYHPGYRDRKLQWAKLYFKVVHGDPEFELIESEIDKWRFVAFICLELDAQKPIPVNDIYLSRKGFDIKKRPIALTLKMLHNFVDIVTVNEKLLYVDKSKNKIRKDKEEEVVNTPGNQLFDYYNETVKTHNVFPSVLKFTKERADKCRARLKDVNFFETFKKALVKAKDTPFLCGTNDRGWKMNFDFLIANDSNVYKILEGKYDGAGKKDYGGQW